MKNDISYKQDQETSIDMIAAYRQKYSDVKRISQIQTMLSIWLPVVLAVITFTLKETSITGLLGSSGIDLSLYVAFYCVVIVILDQFLLVKLIEGGKGFSAKIQERFDTYVLGLPWNGVLVGSKPDSEEIFRLKNRYFKCKGNKKEDLLSWYNPKVSTVEHNKGVLLCQRMNLYWDKSLREEANLRVLMALCFWCVLTLVVALSQDLSLRTLLISVVCPLLPILTYSMKFICDNKNSISTVTRLKELLEATWKDANNQALTNEKLREVQNEIYQHRKSNRPISDSFYWKRKDDFEEYAHYSIEQMINEIDA